MARVESWVLLLLVVSCICGTSAKTFSLSWNVGLANGPAQGIYNATCGDEIAFNWQGSHDLRRTAYVPGAPCDFSTVLETVQGLTAKPNAANTVRYALSSVGTYQFVCTVREPQHCLMGQHATFFVKGPCGATPSPTTAPKPSPKPSKNRKPPGAKKSPPLLEGGRRHQ